MTRAHYFLCSVWPRQTNYNSANSCLALPQPWHVIWLVCFVWSYQTNLCLLTFFKPCTQCSLVPILVPKLTHRLTLILDHPFSYSCPSLLLAFHQALTQSCLQHSTQSSSQHCPILPSHSHPCQSCPAFQFSLPHGFYDHLTNLNLFQQFSQT